MKLLDLVPYINVAVVAGGMAALFAGLVVPMMIFLERKGASFIQDRLGPNRAAINFGFFQLRAIGNLHNLADAIKLMFKEDIIPGGVHRPYFLLAPLLATVVAFSTYAVIPLASPDLFMAVENFENLHFQVLQLDAGVLWILAIASFSTFAIMLAGWASNSKFSLFGALRAGAQMISYELTMGLCVVAMVMVAGTLEPQTMIKYQDSLMFGCIPRWGIIMQPVAFFLFLTCIFAETNRSPFDMAEGESEIVAGYHLEYSSMKFALFFMAEYVNMTVGAMFLVVLFLGGWAVPFVDTEMLLAQPDRVGVVMGLGGAVIFGLVAYGFYRVHRIRRVKPYWHDNRDREAIVLCIGLVLGLVAPCMTLALVCGASEVLGWTWPVWLGPIVVAACQMLAFATKVLFFLWLYVWVRWSVPRFRYDQIMTLGWKVMLPVGLANVAVTGLWLALKDGAMTG